MRRRTFLTKAAVAAGLLAGCTGQGREADATQEPPTESPTPEPTPSPTPTAIPTPTETPTPFPTPPPSPTPTPRSIQIRPIDVPDLEDAIAEEINRARGDRGPLIYDGSLSEELAGMARKHSDRMARARNVAHTIGGKGVKDRYEENELHCTFRDNDDQWVVETRDKEVVGRIALRGKSVDEAAKAIVSKWMDRKDSRYTLTLKNAGYVGVGVVLTEEYAYVTVNLCS